MVSSNTKFEKLEDLDLGEGRSMKFHHFTNNFNSYVELYSPDFGPAEAHHRMIVPIHYHKNHDEHMYILEGKLKLTHQVYADSIPATSTVLPESLPSRITSYFFPAKRPIVWVETLLDATTPDGTRNIDLLRNLKHGIEQLPGSPLRARESNLPDNRFLKKEQFFREFFSEPKMPPFLLVCSTLAERGDFYIGSDTMSYFLSRIGLWFYPQQRVNDEQMRYHYGNTVKRETPTPKTHPLLLGKEAKVNSSDSKGVAVIQDQKKRV